MDTNVNYTIVGAFVIILTAAIVFTVIWLSSGFSLVENAHYLILSNESVSGLSVDSPVEYNGVQVGSVDEISIDEKNPHLVKLLLSIKEHTPITTKTIATLTTRGITGVMYVALKNNSPDMTPLKAQKDYPYPVIPTTPSLFLRLDTELTKLSKNLQSIANGFNSLLDEHNLKSIRGTLDHLDQFTSSLAKSRVDFNTFIESGSRSMKSIDLQTIPETNRLLNNMNSVVNNLENFSTQLKQNPTILIRGETEMPLGPGERK